MRIKNILSSMKLIIFLVEIKTRIYYHVNRYVFIYDKNEVYLLQPKINILIININNQNYNKYISNIKEKTLKKRLNNYYKKKCHIYLATFKDIIVGHYILTSINNYQNDLFVKSKIFDKSGMIIFDCVTFPEFRRLNIYSAVLTYILNEVINLNKKIYITTDINNINSQKGIEKAGFVKKYLVDYKEIFGKKIKEKIKVYS